MGEGILPSKTWRIEPLNQEETGLRLRLRLGLRLRLRLGVGARILPSPFFLLHSRFVGRVKKGTDLRMRLGVDGSEAAPRRNSPSTRPGAGSLTPFRGQRLQPQLARGPRFIRLRSFVCPGPSSSRCPPGAGFPGHLLLIRWPLPDGNAQPGQANECGQTNQGLGTFAFLRSHLLA